MAYKIIYVEDLNPSSIISDLQSQDFEVTHIAPDSFENLIKKIFEVDFQAILLDFRLTQGGGNKVYDAPTIAQTLRTRSANENQHYPIFLISTESIISSFYQDFTSNDLFDLSLAKEVFQQKLKKYCDRLKNFIDSYAFINNSTFDVSEILNIPKETDLIDYRFQEKLNDQYLKTNTYKISRLIYYTLIRFIGTLIGEDVLSSRLGVDKTSEGWSKLEEVFVDAKYSGIFSKSYDRWWARSVEKICAEKLGITNLRRLKSQERVQILTAAGFSGLLPLNTIEFAASNNFWTICKDLQVPIDPIDGLELIPKEILPWQDKEYISILAAMQTSDYLKVVKPAELDRFKDFVKSLEK